MATPTDPSRQRLLALRRLTDPTGLTIDEIATELRVSSDKVARMISSLIETGEIEEAPTSRWRLVPMLRSTANLFMRFAELVGAGEWTTYSEVAIAATGDDNARRAVGRAAATFPEFPNPHRVLNQGGVVAPRWKDSFGRGADYCKSRLAKEGLSFTPDGAADPTRFVNAQMLCDRWDDDPSSVSQPAPLPAHRVGRRH